MTVHFVEDLDSSNVLVSIQTFSATFTEIVCREEFTQNYVFKTHINNSLVSCVFYIYNKWPGLL